MAEYGAENEGDNIEFTAVDIDTYTIWQSMTGTDTATTKFPTANPRTARKIAIRCDKSTDFTDINITTFTNPITIVADKVHIETRNVPVITRIKLRTNATNTKIKVRWF